MFFSLAAEVIFPLSNEIRSTWLPLFFSAPQVHIVPFDRILVGGDLKFLLSVGKL